MEDSLQSEGASQDEAARSIAIRLGKLLEDHRGNDVVVMDMRVLNFWTDFFVIATATSNTHLRGLQGHIKDFAAENDLDILRRSRRIEADAKQQFDEWCLLDLGDIVVHLMSEKTRSFFELERLWSAAPIIHGTLVDGTLVPRHSSKSS